MFLKVSCRWLFICLTSCLLIILLAPLPVRADGGAPNLAYVVGTTQGVSVIDVAQQKVSSTISVSGAPHMVALSLDGRFLYATQPAEGRIAIIIAKTGETFCTANVPGKPDLIVLDPNNTMLYAAGQGASSVTVISGTDCSIKRTLHTAGPVYGLAVAAIGAALPTNGTSGDQLWVADSDALTIFDDGTSKQLGQVGIPAGPRYLSIPPGATVYVTTQQGSVLAIDLNNHGISTLVSGGQYGPMDYNAGTGELYVPDQKNNQLVVLAPVNSGFAPPKEPSRVVNTGAKPMSVAITSDGQLGFVALEGGTVAMLDIPGHEQVLSTINVGGSPQFIITGLYPPPVVINPRQVNTFNGIISGIAYVIVIALFIVPIILFRRYARARPAHQLPKKDQLSDDQSSQY